MEFTERVGGLEVRAPAKLNLFLEVGPRAEDGYHEIDSLFQAVSLYDELVFSRRDDREIVLREEGMADGERNLVHRAARGLAGAIGGVPFGVEIRLVKCIPQGGGLGGGSSDAAATLLALERLWNVTLAEDALVALAAGLGADVPFFLHGGTARCRGRGEKVTSLAPVFDRAPSFHYVLVAPPVHVATKDVYEALDGARGQGFALTPSSPLDSMSPASILERLVRGELFFNRLEEVACGLFGELRELGRLMKAEALRAVQMSGSGSTFFGLAESAAAAHAAAERLREAAGPGTRVHAVRSLPGGSRLAGLAGGRRRGERPRP